VRNAALMINFVPKSKRAISQQKLEQSISRELAERPGHPLLVHRRERPAQRDVHRLRRG
jgi:hypothetical protein